MMKFSNQMTVLNLPIRTGFVKWVRGFDCRLNALAIYDEISIQTALESLYRSHQRNFLKELSLSCHSDFDPTPLNELGHLKKLRLFHSGEIRHSVIDIVSVLRICSDNLMYLDLYGVSLKDELHMGRTFALRELKISSTSLPKQFDLFLSKCCPRLRFLTLDRCLSAGTYFNISNLSLLFLKINLIHPKIKTRSIWEQSKIYLIVVTPKTELLYYLDGYTDRCVARGGNKEISNLLYRSCFPIKSKNLPKVETTTTLSCYSVDTLIVDDRILC
jgi:hypothetical protein